MGDVEMKKTALVIGASRGIGAFLVQDLVKSGYLVAAMARTQSDLDQVVSELPQGAIIPIVRDASDMTNIESDFANICQKLEGLDLIIYCAGVMPIVGENEFSISKDMDMISVNCAGAVMWLNLASQRFQGTGKGCIVGIGSVAGDRGRRGQPVYNASKAFLHSYLESLRNRFAGTAVTVVTIKPGPVNTSLIGHLDFSNMMEPSTASKLILKRIGKNGEFYLSPMHKIIFGIIKILPGWIMRKLRI